MGPKYYCTSELPGVLAPLQTCESRSVELGLEVWTYKKNISGISNATS